MKQFDSLNETFDIVEAGPAQILTENDEVVVQHTDKISENADIDYEASRSNLHNLLMQGQTALQHALDVAQQSEHPRAFEVVGTLIKQLADVNEQLLSLSERRVKLKNSTPQKQEDSKQQANSITNNAIFVGSTAELSKVLKDMKG